MRIIPVLDIRGGRAVHAVAGDRARYGPLRSVYAAEPDPVAVARGLRDGFGAAEVYLADLDAIAGRAAPDLATVRAIAGLGLAPWVDAGLAGEAGVDRLLDAGAARVVAGLETLAGPEALAAIVRAAGPAAVAFSLDLRAGVPVVAPGATWAGDPADEANLVEQAAGAGARAMIRLDLARVGTGRGAAEVPGVATGGDPGPAIEWAAGGGVAGPDDLATLARLGYAAALVGSAVHDGRIRPADLPDGPGPRRDDGRAGLRPPADHQRPSDQLTIRTCPPSSSK